MVNAGDIHPDPQVRDYFHSQIKVDYFHILGNHDYYGGQYLTSSRFLFNKGNLKIAGVTLWTDFKNHDPMVMFRYPRILADGSQIRTFSGRLLADEIYSLHKEDLEFISQNKPDVVFTHHAPSSLSVAEKLKGSGDTNYYFMSNLEDFLLDNENIKLYGHGHMHNVSDYTIGNCRVVANPLGYPGERLSSIDKYEVEILEI